MHVPKRVAVAVVVGLLAFMVLLLPGQAALQVDQAVDTDATGAEALDLDELEQTFTPSFAKLGAVDVFLRAGDGEFDQAVTVRVSVSNMDSGTVVGSSTVVLSASAGGSLGVYNAVFTPALTVVPGQLHVITLEVISNPGGDQVLWGLVDPGPYGGGSAISFGVPQLYDFMFRTYLDDVTPPAITHTVTPASATAPWYNTNVRVEWTVTENESPVTTSGCEPLDLVSESGLTDHTCTASSAGGGPVDDTVTIGIDKTKPVITATRTPANANGWNNGTVSVSFDCTDENSGIATDIPATPIDVTGEGAGQSVSSVDAGTCIDNAGNEADPVTVTDINIDLTPPTIVAAATSSPNAAGWYNTDVTVHFTCADALSDIPFGTCPADQVLTAEGSAVSSTAQTVTDAAGNTSAPSNVVTVQIDKTDPVVTLTVLPGAIAGNAGWYRSDVVVHTEGDVGGSPIVSCTPDQTFTAESAGFDVDGQCTDAAGNTGFATPLHLMIDKTAPTTVVTAFGTEGANGWFITDPVTIDTTGSDSLSGLTDADCTDDQEQSADTTGKTFFGTCTDEAGNPSTSSVFVKLDTTIPTGRMVVVFGTEGDNGWYTSGVVVAATGNDNVSGPVTCDPALQAFGTETSGTTLTATCTNMAGLSVDLSLPIKIDRTPPVTTIAASAAPDGDNGWYITNPTLVTTCAEDVSNPVVGTGPQVISEDTAGLIVTGTCTNNAGLSSSDSETIKLDTSDPTNVKLAVVSGTLGEDGWYTTDIVVRTTGEDSISGPVTCVTDGSTDADLPWTEEEDEPGREFTGSCTNLAGRTTDAAPLLVKIDKTPPVDVTLTPTGTLGNNDWYVSDVVITTDGIEDVSDPIVCTAEQTLQVDTTGQVFNGSCENAAGLVGTADPLTIKRDVTPPTMVLTVPAAVALDSAAVATVVATDVTSGVASTSCEVMDTSTLGAHSVTCTAEDNAGNIVTETVEYQVLSTVPGSGDCGEILFGTLPPAGGGYGTFAFSCGTLDQLLAASGCPQATATFFYNAPGSFIVWIPGTSVAAVNAAFLARFNGDPAIPVNTIFTAKCR